MIAYASRTGTRRNLAVLRNAGWRLMVSARGVLRTEGFPYALDNGAWTAHQKDEPFDSHAFSVAVDQLGDGADFVVLPDQVGGGLHSLAMSLTWLPVLRDRIEVLLLPVQDGMSPADVAPMLGPRLGIFVGGSTEWKLATMEMWGKLAHQEIGCWLHVGRVNSEKRIALCAAAGATSFDGSSVSRYAKNLPRLDHARLMPDMFAPERMQR